MFPDPLQHSVRGEYVWLCASGTHLRVQIKRWIEFRALARSAEKFGEVGKIFTLDFSGSITCFITQLPPLVFINDVLCKHTDLRLESERLQRAKLYCFYTFL